MICLFVNGFDRGLDVHKLVSSVKQCTLQYLIAQSKYLYKLEIIEDPT